MPRSAPEQVIDQDPLSIFSFKLKSPEYLVSDMGTNPGQPQVPLRALAPRTPVHHDDDDKSRAPIDFHSRPDTTDPLYFSGIPSPSELILERCGRKRTPNPRWREDFAKLSGKIKAGNLDV